jgi:hypothetical protein
LSGARVDNVTDGTTERNTDEEGLITTDGNKRRRNRQNQGQGEDAIRVDEGESEDGFRTAREEASECASGNAENRIEMENASNRETEGTGQDPSEEGSKGASGRRARTKTRGTVEGKLVHVIKNMFGSLEMQLLESMEEEWGEEEEEGWSDAHCRRLARTFYMHRSKFAAEALNINTVAGISEGKGRIQWIWDKRKTKAGTEARTVQEGLHETLGNLREAMEEKIKDNVWLEATREFNRQLEAIGMMMDALDLKVDMQDYLRLSNEVDYEPRHRGATETDHTERSRNEREEDTISRPEQEGHAEIQNEGDLPQEDHRHFPREPAMRRSATSTGATRWKSIDRLSVTPCDRLPMGMLTMEFIPNSLQEEWTEAWNTTNELRRSTTTTEEKDRTLKLILWLPQGLLHAPTRGGKNGSRQYKELAMRFVMWRQRDMEGLIRI